MKNLKLEIVGTSKRSGFTCRNAKETQSAKSESGVRTTRSVLGCDGPPPLSERVTVRPVPQSTRGLAQRSKTWRRVAAVVRRWLISPWCSTHSLVSRALTSAATGVWLLTLAGAAHAQTFAIDWSTIDGGGGQSTGGVFSVTGTIGQPDAGKMSGGNFTLTGGFWSVIAAIQTPGAPTLTITPAAPGFATISWIPATPGFVLQETARVSPASWTNSPSGAANPTTVPATLPAKFYRLFKP